MKLESHCDKILLELGYSAVVNVLLPIATMTSNHTPASGPGRNDRFGEFLRKLEVRGVPISIQIKSTNGAWTFDRAMQSSMPFLVRWKPSLARSPVMNSRSRLSTSEVNQGATSAPIWAIMTVGTSTRSDTSQADIKYGCAAGWES